MEEDDIDIDAEYQRIIREDTERTILKIELTSLTWLRDFHRSRIRFEERSRKFDLIVGWAYVAIGCIYIVQILFGESLLNFIYFSIWAGLSLIWFWSARRHRQNVAEFAESLKNEDEAIRIKAERYEQLK
jgi:hypothetical protein